MKPDFLLHLDFEAIRLFNREDNGFWRLVGRVAPDDTEIESAMAKLVAKARKDQTDPIKAVVSLPHDLIFVTEVNTDPDVGWVRRQVEIRAALDATLADPIEDVAFDYETEGANTKAVVVHRETLKEAERFVTTHGIAPLAFISMPRDTEGFHRPALFVQTELGTEFAGETGKIELDVPGTASLRGIGNSAKERAAKSPRVIRLEHEVEPKELDFVEPGAPAVSSSLDTAPLKHVHDNPEQRPHETHYYDDLFDSVLDKPAEMARIAASEAQAGETGPETGKNQDNQSEETAVFVRAMAPSISAEPSAPKGPASQKSLQESSTSTPNRSTATAPAHKPKLDAKRKPNPPKQPSDPFDKLARPFVERPEEHWSGPLIKLLAPFAALATVAAAIAVIAIYVLPSDNNPDVVAASAPEQSSEAARSQAQEQPAEAEPIDPITTPTAENAPANPVSEPVAQEAAPEPAPPAPTDIATLNIPEDPTQAISITALPASEEEQSEQPQPLPEPANTGGRGAQVSQDRAAPDTAEQAQAPALATRIADTPLAPPVLQYEILVPTLSEEALALLEPARPQLRPEGLFATASDGRIVPSDISDITERRPPSRPESLAEPDSAEQAETGDDSAAADGDTIAPTEEAFDSEIAQRETMPLEDPQNALAAQAAALGLSEEARPQARALAVTDAFEESAETTETIASADIAIDSGLNAQAAALGLSADTRPIARAGTSPSTIEVDERSDTELSPESQSLAAFRPTERPRANGIETDAETTETPSLAPEQADALAVAALTTQPELNTRPPERTVEAATAEVIEEAEEPIRVSFTALRPNDRPSGLRRPAPAPRQEQRTAAAPAPQTTAPAGVTTGSSGTSSSSTQAAAAQPQRQPEAAAEPASSRGAPRLGRSRVTLLGTTGTSSSRRALVEVPGRGVSTVRVGDRLDGGRVAAIDVNTLTYTRNGRTLQVQMPR